MLHKIRWFFLLVIGTLVLIVAFQNHAPVQIEILTFSGQYPLTLLLLATAAISFTLGVLTTLWRRRRKGKVLEKKEIPKVEPAAEGEAVAELK